MNEPAIAMIKVRELGKKRWAFLAANGTNALRVHGVRFSSYQRAQAVIDANAPENPGWEWKIVPALTRI
jgi:hypothetical protein